MATSFSNPLSFIRMSNDRTLGPRTVNDNNALNSLRNSLALLGQQQKGSLNLANVKVNAARGLADQKAGLALGFPSITAPGAQKALKDKVATERATAKANLDFARLRPGGNGQLPLPIRVANASANARLGQVQNTQESSGFTIDPKTGAFVKTKNTRRTTVPSTGPELIANSAEEVKNIIANKPLGTMFLVGGDRFRTSNTGNGFEPIQ